MAARCHQPPSPDVKFFDLRTFVVPHDVLACSLLLDIEIQNASQRSIFPALLTEYAAGPRAPITLPKVVSSFGLRCGGSCFYNGRDVANFGFVL